MGTSKTSVVVPVRDAGAHLSSLLRSLEASTGDRPFDVVLSDDGSTDGAIDEVLIQQWAFPLRAIRHPHGSGAGAARNRGVAATDAEIVVFVDADDEVLPGFVAAMSEPLEDGSVALVGARRDFDALNGHLPAAAAILRAAATAPEPIEPGRGLLVSGGSGLALRRDAFDLCGGFDERLRRRQDQDLWLRVQQAGMSVAHAPDAVVLVRRREGASSQLRQRRQAQRGSCTFYALHPELVHSRRVSSKAASIWWILPRLPYLFSRGRRMVLLGGVARWVGRLEGNAEVRRMRRAGLLGPWMGSGPDVRPPA